MSLRRISLTLTLLGLTTWALPLSAKAGCLDYRAWRFGGRSFQDDASDLCQNPVSRDVREGQITYSVKTGPNKTCGIVAKERPVRPGEKLPFGVESTDSPQQTFAKLQAGGAAPLYTVIGHDPTPVGVGPACGDLKAGDYVFGYDFDHEGRMTAVHESLLLPHHEDLDIILVPEAPNRPDGGH